jgi:Uma2 family endonuclease
MAGAAGRDQLPESDHEVGSRRPAQLNGSESMRARRLATGAGPVTLAEYERLPDPDNRLSVVRGMLVREPRPEYGHGLVQARLTVRLDAHVRGAGLGQVVTDVGFVVVQEPLTVLAPDVAFIAKSRVPADPVAVGRLAIAPDLIVEVVSPGERAGALHEKVVAFLEAGTRLAWIVHARVRHVVEWRSLQDIRIRRGDDVLDGADVLPGFRAGVAELLAER